MQVFIYTNEMVYIPKIKGIDCHTVFKKEEPTTRYLQKPDFSNTSGLKVK